MARLSLILISFLLVLMVTQQLPISTSWLPPEVFTTASHLWITPTVETNPNDPVFRTAARNTKTAFPVYKLYYTTAIRTSKTLTKKQLKALHLSLPLRHFLSQNLEQAETSHLRDAICRQIERLEPKTSSFMIQSQAPNINIQLLGMNVWHACYRALSQ